MIGKLVTFPAGLLARVGSKAAGVSDRRPLGRTFTHIFVFWLFLWVELLCEI